MNSKQAISHQAEADKLIMALFFLMTRYARDQDKELIKPIMEHFDWLSSHPDIVNSQMQNTCSRLKKSWLLVSGTEQLNKVLMPSLH